MHGLGHGHFTISVRMVFSSGLSHLFYDGKEYGFRVCSLSCSLKLSEAPQITYLCAQKHTIPFQWEDSSDVSHSNCLRFVLLETCLLLKPSHVFHHRIRKIVLEKTPRGALAHLYLRRLIQSRISVLC